MIDHKEIVRLLQERGFRITPQRRAVLEVITGLTELQTVEDIYEQAKQANPHISLATVYRTLTVLYDNRLIERRYLPSDHMRSRFEPTDVSEHFHFICLGCGKLIVFQSSQGVAGLLRDLGANTQVGEIVQVCACVEGYCRSCSEQKALS